MASTPTDPAAAPSPGLWRPRYWPLWTGVGLVRMIAALPVAARIAAGRLIGRLLYRALPGRRRVAAINLALCFPELDDAARHALLRRHFEALGHAVVDQGLTLWADDATIAASVEIRGLEHLRAHLDRGEGVIMLSAHYGSLEICGRALHTQVERIAVLYRPTRNPVIERLQARARERGSEVLVPKDDPRGVVRLLRAGYAVWYAADQAYQRKHAAAVPFFGVPAMTNTALGELARMGRARVVPAFTRRNPDGRGLVVDIFPALEDFPSGDRVADAARMNRILEDYVRGDPAQYYWVHRRFKGAPGLGDPYARNRATRPAP